MWSWWVRFVIVRQPISRSRPALTGHLVLSTLHTNTAVGALSRLGKHGHPELLCLSNSSVIGLVAQRLIRVLCKDCREPYVASDLERQMLGVEPTRACDPLPARGL